jgi:NAD-dependent dihydropyrimidine dehydrogenase PreA subunit
MKRKIITINEKKCNGCGQCIPNCPEGALQVIDGKARLVSDLFCDGLGACIGHCPTGAMAVIEREAEPYEEKKVMANIVKQGPNTIKAHLMHLKGHGAEEYLAEAVKYLKSKKIPVPDLSLEKPCCPGAKIRDIASNSGSALRQWPIQLNLIPPTAPFLNNAHLLIAADCTAFALGSFHDQLLHGKVIAIGCPKFDETEHYVDKLSTMFKDNKIKSVTVAIMEVPCCSGLYMVVQEALKKSGKDIALMKEVITIHGQMK